MYGDTRFPPAPLESFLMQDDSGQKQPAHLIQQQHSSRHLLSPAPLAVNCRACLLSERHDIFTIRKRHDIYNQNNDGKYDGKDGIASPFALLEDLVAASYPLRLGFTTLSENKLHERFLQAQYSEA